MKRYLMILMFFIFIVASNSVNAWQEFTSTGFAREIHWTFGCTNHTNRRCGDRAGTNFSSLDTNSTIRWVRSSVSRNGRVIRSAANNTGGAHKIQNGIIWNRQRSRASAPVTIGTRNQRYHDFKRR